MKAEKLAELEQARANHLANVRKYEGFGLYNGPFVRASRRRVEALDKEIADWLASDEHQIESGDRWTSHCNCGAELPSDALSIEQHFYPNPAKRKDGTN